MNKNNLEEGLLSLNKNVWFHGMLLEMQLLQQHMYNIIFGESQSS